jgi:hypothetical protein
MNKKRLMLNRSGVFLWAKAVNKSSVTATPFNAFNPEDG